MHDSRQKKRKNLLICASVSMELPVSEGYSEQVDSG